MIDDGSNTAGNLTVLVSKVIFCLAEVESSIAVLAKGVHIVAEKIGHIIFVAFV